MQEECLTVNSKYFNGYKYKTYFINFKYEHFKEIT